MPSEGVSPVVVSHHSIASRCPVTVYIPLGIHPCIPGWCHPSHCKCFKVQICSTVFSVFLNWDFSSILRSQFICSYYHVQLSNWHLLNWDFSSIGSVKFWMARTCDSSWIKVSLQVQNKPCGFLPSPKIKVPSLRHTSGILPLGACGIQLNFQLDDSRSHSESMSQLKAQVNN
jgi:hypothetical protein